jgi:hypothetical protein
MNMVFQNHLMIRFFAKTALTYPEVGAFLSIYVAELLLFHETYFAKKFTKSTVKSPSNVFLKGQVL